MNGFTLPTENDLMPFLESAKERGVSDEFIVTLLRENGWPDRAIFRAFSCFYTQALATPIPVRSRNAEGARDAFYYLLNFITLGFWTVALGQIWYALIARWFPDATDAAFTGQFLREQLSWQVATIIIAFPIFALVHHLIGKYLRERPEAYESGVRKWLTYIALVLASLVVLTDGVWFTNSLLRGELTMRFILDSAVLLALGGGVFSYYLATMNAPEPRS